MLLLMCLWMIPCCKYLFNYENICCSISVVFIFTLSSVCWYKGAFLNVMGDLFHNHCYYAFWQLKIDTLRIVLPVVIIFMIVLNNQIHP